VARQSIGGDMLHRDDGRRERYSFHESRDTAGVPARVTCAW